MTTLTHSYPHLIYTTGCIKKSTAGLFHRSRVTGHGSQVTGHGSRVTGHGSQVTGHRSRVTGHRSRVTGHRSRVTGHRFMSTSTPVMWSFSLQQGIFSVYLVLDRRLCRHVAIVGARSRAFFWGKLTLMAIP